MADLAPITYIDELTLKRPENTYKAYICFCYFPQFSYYQETVKFLNYHELNYYNTLKFEKRIKSYLIGRYTAKRAIAAFCNELNLENIIIEHGIFTQPIVKCKSGQNIQVSITHCDDFGVALAFPEAHPMGIDIERISDAREALERQITDEEKALIKTFPFPYNTMLTYLWTTKEALSKVLRTGLMTPFKLFEIDKLELRNDGSFLNLYKNFAQYKALSFGLGDFICSITYPLKTELTFNYILLRNKFNYSLAENIENGRENLNI
jgi:4'-phosphopantetheinyl transferase